MKTIDLHVHSLFSDGKKSIEEIIGIALKNNVGYLAFAEHYNLASYNVARRLAGDKIEIIPAIEIGTDISGYGLNKNHSCHMIVYYPSQKICIMLDEYEENREKSIKKILELLNRGQKISITYSQVKDLARNKEHVTRFDVAIALYKLGFSSDPITAYGEYLDFNSKCYVSRHKKTPIELVKYVKSVGGSIVVAHPKSLRIAKSSEEGFFGSLAEAGLDGIEVYTPYNDEQRREEYLKICDKFDLIPTVGTDYHGILTREPKGLEIGKGIGNNLNITDTNIIENLKNRAKKN